MRANQLRALNQSERDESKKKRERPGELEKTERERDTRSARRRGVRPGKERGVVCLLLFSAVPLLPFLFTQIYA